MRQRPVYIFLYAPNTSIVNYIDSLVYFCKVEFKKIYREFNHNVSDYYEYVIYKTKQLFTIALRSLYEVLFEINYNCF